MAAESKRPISDHLADFVAAVAAKGGDPKHVRQTRNYASLVIEQAGIARIEDLVPAAVQVALDKLREGGSPPAP